MNKIKVTDNDKVNHYLNNLASKINFWENSYIWLYEDIQKVKDTKKFKEFCIQKHDQWHLQIWVLYLFFNTKKDGK